MVLLLPLQGCYVTCYLEDQAKNIATRSDDGHRQLCNFRATVHDGQYAFKASKCKKTVKVI